MFSKDLSDQSICKLIKLTSSLQNINLSFNMLTDKTGSQILKIFPYNGPIEKLNLNSNFISEFILDAINEEFSKKSHKKQKSQIYTLKAILESAKINQNFKNSAEFTEYQNIDKILQKSSEIEQNFIRIAFNRTIYSEKLKEMLNEDEKWKIKKNAELVEYKQKYEKICSELAEFENIIEHEKSECLENIDKMNHKNARIKERIEMLKKDMVCAKAAIITKVIKKKILKENWKFKLENFKLKLYFL